MVSCRDPLMSYTYTSHRHALFRNPVPNFPSLVDEKKCMRDVTESDVLQAICK